MDKLLIPLIFIMMVKYLKPPRDLLMEGFLLICFMSLESEALLEQIILPLLFIQSLSDLWFYAIYAPIDLMVGIISLLFFLEDPDYIGLLSGAILPLGLILLNRFKRIIGDGDVELLWGLLPLLKRRIWLLFYIAYILLAMRMIFDLMKGKKDLKYPLVPYLSLAFLIIM